MSKWIKIGVALSVLGALGVGLAWLDSRASARSAEAPTETPSQRENLFTRINNKALVVHHAGRDG